MDKKIKKTEIDKETIWADLNLSGSKFKEWCLNPKEFVKNEKKEYSDFVKEKLEIGNAIEAFIFDLAKEKFTDFEFIKDKETFTNENKNFCFANVDGFLIKKDTKEKWILEIKNTEIDNMEELAEIYKYQILYYCWFFSLSKARLIAFINGYKLRYFDFDFTEEQIEFCNQKVTDFERYLKKGILPKSASNVVLDSKKDWLKFADDFAEKYALSKKLEKEIKVAEMQLKEYLIANNIDNLFGNKIILSLKENAGRKSLDKEKLQEFLFLHDKSLADFETTSEATLTLKKDLRNE